MANVIENPYTRVFFSQKRIFSKIESGKYAGGSRESCYFQLFTTTNLELVFFCRLSRHLSTKNFST